MLTKGSVKRRPGDYWKVPPEVTRLRQANAAFLIEFLQNRGDGRLSSWEEAFLAGLAVWLRESQYKPDLSKQQWTKIHEIQAKLKQPLTLLEMATEDEADWA